jgi:predicted transcriptional regulator
MKASINTKNIKLFESLSSSTRIQMLELIGEKARNIGELAALLNISSAITTRHVAMLKDAGLVKTENTPGKRGIQKVCYLATNEIILTFSKNENKKEFKSVSLPIGQYTAYDVVPTCGLASREGFIGVCDDQRYFSDPSHVNAALIWFKTGWVEYRIPSYIISLPALEAIEISLELCSEFPGYKEDWPSDIHFYMNDTLLGVWICPGDFGAAKGAYTPDWWNHGTQHGLLKTIRIAKSGCMLDGIHLSDVNLDQIPIKYGEDLSFRIAIPENSRNPGGVNIFGRGFGNYDQDIEVRVEYE